MFQGYNNQGVRTISILKLVIIEHLSVIKNNISEQESL